MKIKILHIIPKPENKSIAVVEMKGDGPLRKMLVDFRTLDGHDAFHERLTHRVHQVAEQESPAEKARLKGKIKVDTGIKKTGNVLDNLQELVGQEITI